MVTEYGKDVYCGIVRYRSKQSKDESIEPCTVTYLSKDVEGEILINGQQHDIVLYYNMLLNFIEHKEKNEYMKFGSFEENKGFEYFKGIPSL
jgi:hypothetical protein